MDLHARDTLICENTQVGRSEDGSGRVQRHRRRRRRDRAGGRNHPAAAARPMTTLRPSGAGFGLLDHAHGVGARREPVHRS